MKLDISAMKKENHLMEIKLNEQYGKHEDLKEEFRFKDFYSVALTGCRSVEYVIVLI